MDQRKAVGQGLGSDMNKVLAGYIRSFSKLRADRSAGWTDATKGQAPHKPLLLLSVLDFFAEGSMDANLIEFSAELAELFATYWQTVLPDRRGNMALPFFHLRSSKFWHLVPKHGQDENLVAANRGYASQLQKMILGAQLDDDLFMLLQREENRNALRTVLIQTYFAEEYHLALIEQGEVNLQAYLYSQKLLSQSLELDTDAQPKVRDQGFRKAVVRIYEHRCAFCGVRMLTSSGHTAVEAAHIIPWSVSQNDAVRNGIALCRLCHWTFDEGLTGVSAKYQVVLSKELRMMSQNLPGHLLTVESRQILGPTDDSFWPDLGALKWHRKNVFLKK
ncbi:MAG: HNH endonuclease [Anaerolineae bacterium]|jgi:putative restriction endonuclease|nr:HNH endonuclease [Anaerolineae bacterium]MBT7190127.1 HNH endonuclease [Anaerolineae bacterium]